MSPSAISELEDAVRMFSGRGWAPCAIFRLSKLMGLPAELASERIGISIVEMKGVMDGWDTAGGREPCFDSCSHSGGYWTAVALGQRLYRESR